MARIGHCARAGTEFWDAVSDQRTQVRSGAKWYHHADKGL